MMKMVVLLERLSLKRKCPDDLNINIASSEAGAASSALDQVTKKNCQKEPLSTPALQTTQTPKAIPAAVEPVAHPKQLSAIVSAPAAPANTAVNVAASATDDISDSSHANLLQ
eukprot:13074230-Ditylum_brightwellii.AAC.1